MNESNSKKPRVLGWYVGLGVLMITLGVLFGLVGIFIVAKNKQRHRIDEPKQIIPTNSSARADMGSTISSDGLTSLKARLAGP